MHAWAGWHRYQLSTVDIVAFAVAVEHAVQLQDTVIVICVSSSFIYSLPREIQE